MTQDEQNSKYIIRIMNVKNSILFYVVLIMIIFLSGCRSTKYIKTPNLYSKASVDFTNKKVLVLPIRDLDDVLDTEKTHGDFIKTLVKCKTVEVLDILTLYDYFKFDLTGRKIEEQVDLLAEHSPIDYLIFIKIQITSDELLGVNTESLDPDFFDTNSAFAFIEVYDVQDRRLFKKIEYRGKVDNHVQDNTRIRSEKEWTENWFFIQTPRKIAKRCYKKCRKDFIKTLRCKD